VASSKAMAVVGVAAAAIALVGCGGSGDQSSTLASAIQQAPFSAGPLGATTTIKSVHCTETGSSHADTCLVVYNVTDVAASLNQDYLITADGSCDDSYGGHCQWAIPTDVAKPTSQ
jgi:hypothetical protein